MSEGTDDKEDIPSSCALVKSDAFTSIYGGINLLLSCRQIYDEAASVLYSNNSFVFGKVSIDCGPGASWIQLATKKIRQIESAASWCLGSQMQYVRQVKVDVANGCSQSTCLKHSLWHQSMNIAPIVKAMWSPLATKAHFEFICSNASSDDGDGQLYFDINTVNTVREYLCADTDGFKKYSRQVVAVITSPFMSAPERKLKGAGYVVLGRNGSHRDGRQYFLLHPGMENGKLRATMRSPAPHLHGLPPSIRYRIYRYFLVFKKAASVNLPLSIDQIREFYMDIFYIKGSFDAGRLLG